MKSTTVSIVIATYRRPAMLRDSLHSLRSLTIPVGVTLEVLVIDNDPDCSAAVATQELVSQCASVFELRYIPEPRTGLSFARNRGIDEAQGEIVAFLDDDIFASASWLVAMLNCFEQTGAAAVGGRVETYWEGEPAPAVRECEDRLFTLDLGDRDFPLRGRWVPGGGNSAFRRSVFLPAGCNSAFRRSVFDSGLRFSTELGRVGKVLLSGEDTELFLRLRQRGHAVWYCGGGLMQHRVSGERLTADYLVRRNFWFGCSYAIIDLRLKGKFSQSLTATARLGKLVLVDLPRLSVAWLRGDSTGKLVARCSISKQAGYLRTTLLPPAVAPPVETSVNDSVGGRNIGEPASAVE